MDIILGEEQQAALEDIIRFTKSNKIAYSLIGYAGTGKSFLVKSLVEYLESARKQYVLTVPTHKAKTVLERFTEREGMTLHKLLSLSPNIQILNLDFKDLQFYTHGNSMLFPSHGIIICDESSMVNDELFELLISKCEQYYSQIIFIGDSKQLKPVTSISISKVFDLKDQFILTKIFRQKEESGLSDILPILREGIVNRFSTSIGTEGSLLCHTDVKDFFTDAVKYAKKAMKTNDILETKILAYTNSRASAFNLKMKEVLFGNKSEYDLFGTITGTENLEFNGTKFWNSMDYIIIDKPIKVPIAVPGFITLPGYKLNLYNSSNKRREEVCIISKDVNKDYLDSLAMFIEDVRVDAIHSKGRNNRRASMLWKNYYNILKSFTTPFDIYYDGRLIRKKSFDHGYAVTVHKSQGSSINNVFIDMKNISICRDREELRQLQYVAVSRATTNAHILQ